MKAAELRGLSKVELEEKANELRASLHNLRTQAATGVLEGKMQIRNTKRDVARVLTVLRQVEMSADEAKE